MTLTAYSNHQDQDRLVRLELLDAELTSTLSEVSIAAIGSRRRNCLVCVRVHV